MKATQTWLVSLVKYGTKGFWVCLIWVGVVGMVLWSQSCSSQTAQGCKVNRDCASGSCDPSTLRCASPANESAAETDLENQNLDASASSDTSPQDHSIVSDVNTSTESTNPPTEQPNEPTTGVESTPEEAPVQDNVPEGGGSSESSNPPDSSVIQGACQGQEPRCPSGYLCRDEVQPAQCHQVCDPAAANSCPAGFVCQVLLTGEGMCVAGKEAQKGGTCDNSNICGQGLICLRSSETSPDGTCEVRCTLQNQSVCTSGTFCYLIHSRNGVCITGQAGTKGAGQSCQRTPECAAGLICFTPFQQTSRCAQLCDAQAKCPTGETCVPLDNAPKDAGACVKP